MTPQFTTEGAASWAEGVSSTDLDAFWSFVTKRGRSCLRRANITTRSDDLALLAYLCWLGMSELHHKGQLDSDYEVAGDVLDQYVTDHDAELLCEAVPDLGMFATLPIGGMTPEVTAIHGALLAVVGVMRDNWAAQD